VLICLKSNFTAFLIKYHYFYLILIIKRVKTRILVYSTKVHNGRTLELPQTDFAICLHTCAIQHQTQNAAQMFTLHSRVRSLILQYPLQCEATSPSTVCAMKPTQQTTKKKDVSLVPSRFNFMYANGFFTSVRLPFPSPHSKISG